MSYRRLGIQNISQPKYINGYVLYGHLEIVYGPSGSGKTNYVFNLLLDHVYYSMLYACKMLDEQKYEFLQNVYKKLSEKIPFKGIALFCANV